MKRIYFVSKKKCHFQGLHVKNGFSVKIYTGEFDAMMAP